MTSIYMIEIKLISTLSININIFYTYLRWGYMRIKELLGDVKCYLPSKSVIIFDYYEFI